MASNKFELKSLAEEALTKAHLRFEKCELLEAKEDFELALEVAKQEGEPQKIGEALVGLLRYAGEALDEPAIQFWEKELDQLVAQYPNALPDSVHYCKGAIATYRKQWKVAQNHFRRYLRDLRRRQDLSPSDFKRQMARALVMLANTLQQRGHLRRAEWFGHVALENFEDKKIRGINGVVYLLLGNIAERRADYESALLWFKKAHGSFLEEHNWYHHLYVLYAYARIARCRKNFDEARFYLELIEKAASAKEFGILRRELALERTRLEGDAVDLLIDCDHGTVMTRESGQVSFRKQYVLLEILKALSDAHQNEIQAQNSRTPTGGLSKAELIRKVWHERYRPEAHDNKLYYNINRLRNLIEPEVKKPKYLLSCKDGYRLAPGLRVRYLDSTHQMGREGGNVS